jgi:hypothetical protein
MTRPIDSNRDDDPDGPIPGMSALRETTPPPSLLPAVMQRIAQPAPTTAWSLLGKSRSEAPIPGMSALRETTPPPSLVPAVMQRIAEPVPVSFWSWLRKSRRFELRLSPIGALSMAAASIAIVSVMVVGSAGRHRPAMVVEVPAAAANIAGTVEVTVRFTLMAQGARKVAVAGDFNNWDPESAQLVNQDGKGNFVGTMKLPAGAHEYMFVVDGEWVTDPTAAELRPDGFGRTNAVLRL